MKQIEIKKAPDNVKFTENEVLTTRHLINMVLDKQPAGGFSRDDIKKRNRIEAIINEVPKGSPYLLLEDSDHTELKKLADGMTWAVRHKFIEEFLNDLDNAQSVKPAALADITPSKNGKGEVKNENIKSRKL